MKQFLAGLVLATVILAGASPALVAQPAPKKDNRTRLAEALPRAIEKARDWLLVMQMPSGAVADHDAENAVVALALLESGLPVANEKFERLLALLAGVQSDRTPFVAMRAELFMRALPQMSGAADRRIADTVIKKDLAGLVAAQRDDGAWQWRLAADWPSFEPTYEAYQALLLATAEGYKIPDLCLKKTVSLLAQKQHDNGGWHDDPNAKMSDGTDVAATARAVVCLAQFGEDVCTCKESATRAQQTLQRCLEKGLGHLEDCYRNWAGGDGPKDWYFYRQNYYLGRLIHAAPRETLGAADLTAHWYLNVLKRQLPEGRWNVPDDADRNFRIMATAFVLYELAQLAKPPLVCEMVDDPRQPRLANRGLWNAVETVSLRWPAACRYARAALAADFERYKAVPLMYLTVKPTFKLLDEEKKNLQAYVEAGGTIIAQVDCGDREAASAAKRELEAVWPNARCEPLLRTHPLWSAQENIVNRPPVLGLDDGLRTFGFVLQSNVICDLSLGLGGPRMPAFQLFSNLAAYALEGQLDLTKPLDVPPDETEPQLGPSKIISVGLLQPADKSVPAALVYNGWPKAAELLPRVAGLRLLGPKALACTDRNLPLCDVAHLPAAQAVALDAEEIKALRTYLEGGGFLLLEARLGNDPFAKSAKRIAEDLGLAVEAAKGSPLLTGKFTTAKGFSVEKTRLRKDGKLTEAETDLRLLTLGGKPVGAFSPADLTLSAAGVRCWGLRGYAPNDARRLLANLILLRSDKSQ